MMIMCAHQFIILFSCALLYSKDTIEEKIVERATKKLFLDFVVIQQGRLTEKSRKLNAQALTSMIWFGASRIFQSTKSLITDDDIVKWNNMK